MNRREKLLLRQRERRLKHIGFTILLVIVIGACGKATLSRSPDEVEESDTLAEESEETVSMVTTRAGIVKSIDPDTSLYSEGSHYLEGADGEFDVLLISEEVILDEYEDEMVEIEGKLRSVRGDATVKIMEVQSLSSASAKINGDAVDAVKRLADPSYGFTDTDTYTLASSSASAGTAVVKVEKGTRTFHVKLVKKPDPLTGEWEIYEIREGGAGFAETEAVEESESDAPATTNGLKEPVAAKEAYKTYEDPLAGFTIQYPAAWFFWAAGEAQTAEAKPVSSRVLFSDVTVEYENVLIGLDIAPVGFQQTLTSYYLNPATETATTVRGVKATKRIYSTGHVRIFVPRDATTTFIISAIPRDGATKTDLLTSMLETLFKTT